MFGPSGSPAAMLAMLMLSVIHSVIAVLLYVFWTRKQRKIWYKKIRMGVRVLLGSYLWFVMFYLLCVVIFNQFAVREFQYHPDKSTYGNWFMEIAFLLFYYALFRYLKRPSFPGDFKET